MIKTFLALAFIISAFTLPWFVAFAVAVWYLAEGGSVLLLLAGGFAMDELTGAPVASLHGFSFLYTFLALTLVLVTLYLRQMLLE